MNRMVKLISIVAAVLLAGYIVFAFFFFREEKRSGTCQGIQIHVKDQLKTQFVTEADLTNILKTANLYPVNKSITQINTYKIESELLKNGMIDKVEVYKTPSRMVVVEVTQKNPVLRIISVRGNYYVDDKGRTMPISRRYVVDVPVASGYVEKELAMTDLYKFALFLQNNDFWNNQIEQIYVHPNKEINLIPRVGNQRIILGSFDNFEEKLNNLRLFYEQAIPKVGWEKYSVINLKYKNQVVCTKRQEL